MERTIGAWTLHWPEDAAALRPWRAAVETQIAAARAAIAGLIPAPPLDVLVRHTPGRGIPELGLGARAHRRNCFSIGLDPGNPYFTAALQTGKVCSSAVHEANHCMRMAGPGYGRTLGEALVSEGLAGHFTQHVLGTPPEPWESAVGIDVLLEHFPGAEQRNAPFYSHQAWFFGAGGRYPRWFGYTLGFVIVEEWRSQCSPDAAALIQTPAPEVLSAAIPRLESRKRI